VNTGPPWQHHQPTSLQDFEVTPPVLLEASLSRVPR